MAFEFSFGLQIIIDVVLGIILGVVFGQIQRAMLVAGMAGFLLTIIHVGLGNPEAFSSITIAEANERITFIVTSTVYFMVHLLFVEIGAVPSNLITQFIKDR